MDHEDADRVDDEHGEDDDEAERREDSNTPDNNGAERPHRNTDADETHDEVENERSETKNVEVVDLPRPAPTKRNATDDSQMTKSGSWRRKKRMIGCRLGW